MLFSELQDKCWRTPITSRLPKKINTIHPAAPWVSKWLILSRGNPSLTQIGEGEGGVVRCRPIGGGWFLQFTKQAPPTLRSPVSLTSFGGISSLLQFTNILASIKKHITDLPAATHSSGRDLSYPFQFLFLKARLALWMQWSGLRCISSGGGKVVSNQVCNISWYCCGESLHDSRV